MLKSPLSAKGFSEGLRENRAGLDFDVTFRVLTLKSDTAQKEAVTTQSA